MPSRQIVANELATVLRQISHPDRIRLIQKLRVGDQTVNEMAAALDITPTRLSQHLAVLRALGLVEIKSIGQNRFYRLTQPQLALWLIEGIDFIAHRIGRVSESDMEHAKRLWELDSVGAL
ncbi:MAG: ArsR/SmtB family transcription factor [Blastomonas fulva]|jgi:DNA-binding transcriptional ArsR family regulator|uniref:ArsR/SmtB family transcription factor n=1 Tax=Blastomonas TaxID=150203 RepID=UPI00083CF4F7|nr:MULTISPECIES: metalloregulator ArsR/SmtB family transcription factor [Blastomonas]AOF98959.1 bacterial regulatory, arsR family protein [Blastomonas sp. RAC04]MCO5794691.1 helix-turn-helix transcriptional regulator [Blastomonas sp.]MDM7929368.1 metalloregulator ArsR/SmtB family transcription factor [Blastomonas fulva]MDM7967656.1 metalloregulator ArsR/SmtB family transcription factor [Blastomonas fulva]